MSSIEMASSSAMSLPTTSEFYTWSTNAIQALQSNLQVPMEADHPSTPLFDLHNIYQCFLDKDSVAHKIQKLVDETEEHSPTTCTLCGESGLNSKMSQYLHKHLKHNQFQCLICNFSFQNVSQLVEHLETVHKIKEKSELPPDLKSIFVCTECSAVVHGLDLESHSIDCNTKPFFPLQEGKATDFEASEVLLQKLRADEIITEQEISCLQTNVDRLNEKKRRWAVEHLKLTSSREFQQFKTMRTLMGKLSAMKHRLTQSEQGCERNYQRKYLERVSVQLQAVHKAYLKTEKSWHTISKLAETLETRLHFLEKETKKKALQIVNLKKRLSKIRMQREIEDLEMECVYLCGQF